MGLEPVCHVCSPQSCDIFEKCKGKQTVEEGTIAEAVAEELAVLQVRTGAVGNIQKRALLQEQLNRLKDDLKEQAVWHIRYEGTVGNPRFRGFRRRTCSIVTDAEGAKLHAEALERDLGVKVLWIRPKEVKP